VKGLSHNGDDRVGSGTSGRLGHGIDGCRSFLDPELETIVSQVGVQGERTLDAKEGPAVGGEHRPGLPIHGHRRGIPVEHRR